MQSEPDAWYPAPVRNRFSLVLPGAWLSLLVALSGCKRDPAPQPSPLPPAASLSGPVASASPAPRPTFGVVTELPPGSTLAPAGDRAFLVAGGQIYLLDAQGLHTTPESQAGAPLAGLENQEVEIVGSFPDALWLLARPSSPQGNPGWQTFRWATDRWARVQPLESDEQILGVARTGGQQAVALVADARGGLRLIRGNDRSDTPSQPTEEPSTSTSTAGAAGAATTAGEGRRRTAAEREKPVAADEARRLLREAAAGEKRAVAALAGEKRTVEGEGAGESPGVTMVAEVRRPSRLKNTRRGGRGRAVAGLEAGHLFAVGVAESLDGKQVLVERWSPRGTSVLDVLPAAPEALAGALGIVAISPEDVYVFSMARGSYLAHFDGTTWKREKVPNDLMIHDLLGTGDGGVYLATEGPLFRRNKGESSWSEVPLPQCGEVLSLAVVGSQLWATGKQHGEGLALLGPPPETPVKLQPGSPAGGPR